jgi:ribonuclease HI
MYIDGASQGNPGEAGIGVIICEGDNVIKNMSQYIGIATNNVAEYMALIFGLQEALVQRINDLKINTDSELLCKQIKGEYKVKDATLKLFHCLAKHLLASFERVDIANIPRENNKGADKLAEKAIEKRPVLFKHKKRLKASQDDQLLGLV